MKFGIYVSMKVLNGVVTFCAICNFKMATSWGQTLHWKPIRNSIFIFFWRTVEQNFIKLGRYVSNEVLLLWCRFFKNIAAMGLWNFFSNERQVSDSGSWEPLVCIVLIKIKSFKFNYFHVFLH